MICGRGPIGGDGQLARVAALRLQHKESAPVRSNVIKVLSRLREPPELGFWTVSGLEQARPEAVLIFGPFR